MTKQKIELFIGADNTSHKISLDYLNRLCSILNKHFSGYTIESQNIGVWESQQEESLKVLIFTDSEPDLKPVVLEIKEELKQSAILINIEKSDYEVY